MSWSDPIADMLTRIRNAQAAGHDVVEMPASNLKAAIVKVLKDEGYVADYEVEGDVKRVLRIALKYNAEGKPVIRGIRRESASGLEARRRKLGGEIVCSVW